MNKLKFLIAAAAILAVVACSKDGASSASVSSGFSTSNGTLKVTVNNWVLEDFGEGHVTMTETGDGLTFGFYNIFPCYPELFITGCSSDGNQYQGEKVLAEGIRSVYFKAAIDSSKRMYLNIADVHYDSTFVGRKWMLASSGQEEEFKEEGYVSDNDTALYFLKTVKFEAPAINIKSTGMNFKVKNPQRFHDPALGSTDSLVDFNKWCEISQSLSRASAVCEMGVDGHVEYDASGENPHKVLTDTTFTMGTVCSVLSNIEYFEFSAYGRFGMGMEDFYKCRAREVLPYAYCGWYGESSGYYYQKKYKPADITEARSLHNAIYNFINPFSLNKATDLVNPYSDDCLIRFGQAEDGKVNICTGKVGDMLISLANVVLKDVLYSSFSFKEGHFDIPLKILSNKDDRLKIGIDQTIVKEIVNDLWNNLGMADDQVKDWSKLLPGYAALDSLIGSGSKSVYSNGGSSEEPKKYFTEETYKKVKDGLSVLKRALDDGAELEISVEFIPYDVTKKMPWEDFLIKTLSEQDKNKATKY